MKHTNLKVYNLVTCTNLATYNNSYVHLKYIKKLLTRPQHSNIPIRLNIGYFWY